MARRQEREPDTVWGYGLPFFQAPEGEGKSSASGELVVRYVYHKNVWYEAIFFISTYLLDTAREQVLALYLPLLALKAHYLSVKPSSRLTRTKVSSNSISSPTRLKASSQAEFESMGNRRRTLVC